MNFKLVRHKEVAGVDTDKFNTMLGYFKHYLKAEGEISSNTNKNTGAVSIGIDITSDSGIEAIASGVIALKAASQKADLHLYLQKVECEDDEGDVYHLTFTGVCH